MATACFIIITALITGTIGQGSYPNTLTLNANYQLSWKLLNTTHIQFKAEVQGARWLGFGISRTGAMFPGDVTIGYTSPTTNTIVLNDFHTTGHVRPTLDASQDWSMISGSIANNNVRFEFVRALDTQDNDDIPIKPGMTHVIWAYSYNLTALPTPYHGANRGTVDIELVQSAAVVGK